MKMKLINVAAFVLLFISFMHAQEFNKTIIDDKTEKPMLIGYTTREAFSDSNFAWWFDSEYEMYEFDSAAVDKLKELMNDVEITIVMGTWCSDSREHVPAFFKILDEINFPEDKITMISVDREKESEDTNVDELGVELVPSFIFFKDDSEIGRIEEMPDETLEEDMLEILSGDSSGEL